ncbi:MAG: gamma carbonic anhydrase family protein [Rhodocyclaceae bacterium]|jgi:carbonic anhydrase/acetyltransferase-like protein (isoleucine patch superfamily)|nr:MAG: gamma carbonic anhydrase family protein [Rhodocyclaceae bacterium]
MIYSLGDKTPRIDPQSWIAPNATVIGDVELQRDASIWFNAIVRGDCDRIVIGEGSNIQDGAVLHTDPGVALTIGKHVTVGHLAMVHGCTVGDGSLIGINAVILNNVVIGRECIIGANALIPEGRVIPDRSLVVGSPGKVVRQLSDEEATGLHESAHHYVDNARDFAAGLKPVA